MSVPEKIALPDFTAVMRALSYLKVRSQAAEAHGLLAALLAGNVSLRRQAWVDSLLTTNFQKGDVSAQESQATLLSLFDAAVRYFKEDDTLSFQLLLPEDEEPIALRIEALAEWCQGFLSGLNIMHINEGAVDSPDVKEALQDLTKMACLAHDDEQDGDEEIEAAFVELVEFARVAVVLVHDYVLQRNQKWAVTGNDTQH